MSTKKRPILYGLGVLAVCVLITEIALAIWLPLRECEPQVPEVTEAPEVPGNPEEKLTAQGSFSEHVLQAVVYI